ncbi:MAG: hypothetical protein IT440_14735 [Phycisphaeraceae bacterium]|nr:hypothetical protein [Phycisphaeraceae bacterium]
MKIKTVTHHILCDYHGDHLSDYTGDPHEMREKNPKAFHNLAAFCCMLNHPDGGLYCGMTRFNGDFFHRFDVHTHKFESLGYDKIAEIFECKIHRSLCLASDGTIYGATAGLHLENQRLDAPGGAIFRYDPKTKELKKLAVPVAHDYIQTITMDEKRKIIYGQTYPVFKFFVYHMDSGRVDNHDFTGSISHISDIDDRGGYWSTWNGTNHWLFRYDPDQARAQWFRHSLPNAKADANIMYPNAGPIDVMLNGRDGWLYVGTCGGSLCRIHAESAEVEYLGHPAPTRRMPGLKHLDEDRLLGCCGDQDGGCLFIYHKKTKQFEVLGSIIDTRTGLSLYRTHDLEIGSNGHVYVAETDVPTRSGYLWEIELQDW